MSAESDNHFFGPGPKRVLALDGGGTRGIIELAFLERIETLLRARLGDDPSFRLCDWFDLIGGTSTGAIIAACLATGMSVAEVTALYFDLAPKAFKAHRWRIPGFAPRFDARVLTRLLTDCFGDCRLDSDKLRTGFSVMARRFDTDSPWLISNNPRGPYWEDAADGSFIGNRAYSLADVVRASTAAPGYFSPQAIRIAQGEPVGLFIDGGLSPYNNPSLALLMLTQARAFGLQWKMGAQDLSLISVGTGMSSCRSPGGPKPPATSGGLVLRALMNTLADGQLLTLTLLQWFADTPQPWTINSEIGDLSGEVLGGRALLRFQRYDMPLDAAWLQENLGIGLPESALVRLRLMDRYDSMKEIHTMAASAAAKQVQLDHL